MGTKTPRGYRPSNLIKNPPAPHELTLELLLAAQAHLGHSTSLWHPANSRYIFGIRQGIHIIDLSLTLAHLRRACKVVEGVAERGGLILFVGNRNGQVRVVVNAAKLSGACHLFSRWIPGTITNGPSLLGNLKQIVVDEFDREVPGFEEQMIDRGALKPDLVICLNPPENYVLLHECGIHGIPTIGIVDTDQDPSWVTYPIPANDDSGRTVGVIAGALGRAGEAGQRRRQELARNGVVRYQGPRGLSPLMRTETELGAAEGDEASAEASAEASQSGEPPAANVEDATAAASVGIEEPPAARLGSGVPGDQTAPSHVPGMKVEHATSPVAESMPSSSVDPVDDLDPTAERDTADRSKRAAKREQVELDTGRSEVGSQR